ncbi:MAG TPA: aldo/keto reductase [Polyangiaceae bacterium]|nr:aldo/keto reductase [Polyangiaceae bacterium]
MSTRQPAPSAEGSEADWVLPKILVGTERLGSPVAFGRGTVLGRGTDRDAHAWLDEMFAAGARGFDTAASYQMGGSERALGAWLASRGLRSEVFLVTKGGHPYPVVRPNRLGLADIENDLHDSLRRLNTERIDLYLLHRDHPDADLAGLAEAFERYRRQGKIAAWGVSNWHHDRILEFQRVARSCGVAGPSASSPQFSLAEWSTPPWKGCVSISGAAGRQARDFYVRSGLPILAWSALGRGVFSGSHEVQASYANAANDAKRKRLFELAERRGVAPLALALAYVTQQPFAVHPVVAVGSARHFEANVAALDLQLGAHELLFLEQG